MKPTMIFAIVMISAIIIMATSGLHMGDITPLVVSPDMQAKALFVCPAADSTWDGIAQAMRPMNRFLIMAFFGVVVVLAAVWGWQLYINLVKDKFERASFTKVWQITKWFFWASVIVFILSTNPNHYRGVRLDNNDQAWVLCENNTPGRRAVRADMVRSH